MQRIRFLRIALGLACAAALAVPVVGQAGQSSSKATAARSTRPTTRATC
jgi:hypothetical protein